MTRERQVGNYDAVTREGAELFARRIGRPEMTYEEVLALEDGLRASYRAAEIDREQAVAHWLANRAPSKQASGHPEG